MYSNGESERIIGKALKKYNIPRHKIQILTKCFITVGEAPEIGFATHAEELGKSRDYVNQSGKCLALSCAVHCGAGMSLLLCLFARSLFLRTM